MYDKILYLHLKEFKSTLSPAAGNLNVLQI